MRNYKQVSIPALVNPVILTMTAGATKSLINIVRGPDRRIEGK